LLLSPTRSFSSSPSSSVLLLVVVAAVAVVVPPLQAAEALLQSVLVPCLSLPLPSDRRLLLLRLSLRPWRVCR
jgi:hypothetical protein